MPTNGQGGEPWLNSLPLSLLPGGLARLRTAPLVMPPLTMRQPFRFSPVTETDADYRGHIGLVPRSVRFRPDAEQAHSRGVVEFHAATTGTEIDSRCTWVVCVSLRSPPTSTWHSHLWRSVYPRLRETDQPPLQIVAFWEPRHPRLPHSRFEPV